jgi:Na+-driven multidrug efflux pump
MGFNIFYCNYFQAIVLPRAAFLICLLRGLILNIGLVFLLPAIWGANAIWFVIPAVEVLTFGVSLILVKRMSPQQRILVSS